MRTHSSMFFRRAAVAAIAASLIAAGSPASLAYAEDQDLESLQEAAIQAGTAYDEAQARVDDLNQRIDQNEARLQEIQDQLPGLRGNAAVAIATTYKMQQGTSALLSLLFSAEDFSTFLDQVAYLNRITANATDNIEDLTDAEDELQTTSQELASQRDELEAQAASAQQAHQDAQSAVDAAKQKAMENAATAQAAYEAAQAEGQQDPTVTEIEQADAGDAAQDATPSDNQASQPTDSGSSSDAGSASIPSQPQQQEQSQQQDSGSTSGGSSSGDSSASYTYVQASMYGRGDGLMYATTASGQTLTPTSMGVAMRTMPLGTVIEITYNGRTVQAVVNDRGPFSGNRQIDLQPAVADALGFSGVGTVGYRVVG